MTTFCISYPGSESFSVFTEEAHGADELVVMPFKGKAGISIKMKELGTVAVPGIVPRNGQPGPPEATRENHIRLVARAIDHIKAYGLGKVVVSRFLDLPISIACDEVFEKLTRAYPEACVYMLDDEGAGTWLGATPETLLEVSGNQVRSMSLAGTTGVDNPEGLGQKEQDEQAMVTGFISEAFTSAGARKVDVLGPQHTRAGNLIHLQSIIQARVSPGFDFGQLLDRLHPTPAVAGLPRKEALEFLNQHEVYDRELYTGYFGMKSRNRQRYFVNLRCMQVFPNRVRLYAGGGITAESDPVSEWLETERKLDTLRNILL